MGNNNFIVRKAKLLIVRQLINLLLGTAARMPDKFLQLILRLGELGAPTPHHREQVKFIRKLVNKKHPSVKLIKKLLTEIQPSYRRCVIENLFIRAAWEGRLIRERFLEEEGFYPPFFMVITPIQRCNWSCIGCYAGKYDKQTDMPAELFERLLFEGKELGMHFITISGGEPFMYPGILDIFEKYHDIVFLVYTNGSFIDAKVAKKLAKLGNVAPAISVEGLREPTEARGRNWDKIMAAMDNLSRERCLFGFSATYTSRNVEDIANEEFIDFMIDKGCSFGWLFSYVPCGKDASIELCPTAAQQDMMRRFTIQMRRNKPIFIADFWNDGPLTGGCMAGGTLYLHIQPNGDVEPCVFIHFTADNIKEKSLREVLKSPFFVAIRRRQASPDGIHILQCMIKHHPEDLRMAVKEGSARPSYPGAEVIITDLAEGMDEIARKYAEEYARRAWYEEDAYYWWTKAKGKDKLLVKL